MCDDVARTVGQHSKRRSERPTKPADENTTSESTANGTRCVRGRAQAPLQAPAAARTPAPPVSLPLFVDVAPTKMSSTSPCCSAKVAAISAPRPPFLSWPSAALAPTATMRYSPLAAMVCVTIEPHVLNVFSKRPAWFGAAVHRGASIFVRCVLTSVLVLTQTNIFIHLKNKESADVSLYRT